MNLDHTPHPLIEDHYHIRELIDGQEKRTAERVHHQEVEKNRDSFLREIQGFKDIEFLDFYCEDCKRDFTARAHKQVDSWSDVAYYKIKHSCGAWCIRHITDRVRDPYFFRSKRVAYDRTMNANDMLQPWQTGFNMIYGKGSR